MPGAAAPGADSAASTPSPAASTQAALQVKVHWHTDEPSHEPHSPGLLPLPPPTLQLLSRATRRHPAALRCLADGGTRLLLTLPQACLFPSFARAEPLIIATLLNMLEDPTTLDAWMEGEIRAFFASRPQQMRGSIPHPAGAQAAACQVGRGSRALVFTRWWSFCDEMSTISTQCDICVTCV